MFQKPSTNHDELMRRGGDQGTPTTYYLSLFTKKGVALHSVVAVGSDEVKDVVVGRVC